MSLTSGGRSPGSWVQPHNCCLPFAWNTFPMLYSALASPTFRTVKKHRLPLSFSRRFSCLCLCWFVWISKYMYVILPYRPALEKCPGVFGSRQRPHRNALILLKCYRGCRWPFLLQFGLLLFCGGKTSLAISGRVKDRVIARRSCTIRINITAFLRPL